MRRSIVVAVVAAIMLLAAVPASAAPTTDVHGGWVPAPSAPFDRAAGVLCDFPVHGEPIVDEVRKRVLATYPDGSPKREAYVGALIVRVTNTTTGDFVDADASGNALIDYGTDGSMTWYVVGPVLVGFREGGGNLARGLYVLDGVYRIAFSATGYKTVTMVTGTQDNLCTHLV